MLFRSIAGPTAGAKTVTVAVNVTGVPGAACAGATTKVVLVAPGCTTWVSVGLLDAAFEASPAYAAVITALPTGKVLTLNTAVRVLPVPLRFAVPKVAAPEMKLTVPVGAIPVTVAVRLVA